MNATFIKEFPPNEAGAIHKLYELSEPYDIKDWNDDSVKFSVNFVIVSAVNAMFTGPETYIFPADETGEVVEWTELPGSYRGGYDHEYAISRFEGSK